MNKVSDNLFLGKEASIGKMVGKDPTNNLPGLLRYVEFSVIREKASTKERTAFKMGWKYQYSK